MTYLLIGDNHLAKDTHIKKIKERWLKSRDALKFDFDHLDGKRLDPVELKKKFLDLPAIASKRVLLIDHVHKLTKHNKELIEEFMESSEEHPVLILETDSEQLKNAFFKKVMSLGEVVDCQGARKKNVFDMTRAMQSRNPTQALKILSELLDKGVHPLQILGGMVWFWGTLRGRLGAENFKKGLLILQEADLNIKRSRLRPENAVEVLVVKLSSLIA